MNYSSLLPAGSMADNTTTVAVSSFYGSRQTFDWIDLLILLLVLGLLFASGPLWAQAAPAGLVDLDSLKAEANVPNDMATSIFNNLFGPIFASPFTAAGGATTLFGVIFLAFNVVVFSAGVVWATYGVVAGVVQSAHEGVVLGKRMSAIWMPIRMVTGIGSLVPAFGGFSLSQVVMIFAAGWGITFGNYAYLKALTAASNFTPLVNLNSPASGQVKTTEELARAIFEQELCAIDAEEHQAAYRLAGNSVPASDILTVNNDAFQRAAGTAQSMGTTFGTVADPARCGSVGIRYSGGATRSQTSFLGFRSVNVDYNAISQGAYGRYAAGYNAFSVRVRQLARQWARNVVNASEATGVPTPAVPQELILAAANDYTASTRDTTSTQRGDAIKAAAFDNMRQFGFLGAGAFYSTLAELNTSIAQANQSVGYVMVGPSEASQTADSNSSSDRNRFRTAYANQMTSGNKSSDSTLSTPPGGSCFDNGADDSILSGFTSGGCSIGQSMVDMMLRGATAGSSTGGTGSFRMIDPIIAAKNLGDYLMTGGGALMAVMTLLPDSDKKSGSSDGEDGVLKTIIKKVNPISYFLERISSAILSLLPIIAGLMIGLGALLAIYIPMVPFINWVSAIVQYVSTVVEAMAAAPLWSFTHLQPDGEGMGSRTERGYIYLLLMLFTPILMVVGFFAACGLVILTGSAVLWLFMPAMANVQGNSVTGIFSIIGFVFIFFLLMNILIQGLFNLTMDLKDDVIGWIGNVGRSQIGRDTESKASNLFAMGGRIASGHAQTMVGAGVKPKVDRDDGSGGSGRRDKR